MGFNLVSILMRVWGSVLILLIKFIFYIFTVLRLFERERDWLSHAVNPNLILLQFSFSQIVSLIDFFGCQCFAKKISSRKIPELIKNKYSPFRPELALQAQK
jgi:hypothetical protein